MTVARDARVTHPLGASARSAIAAGLVVLLVSCGGHRDAPASTLGGTGTSAAVSGSTNGVGATLGSAPDAAHCPHDGRWRLCSVAVRLDKAGLAPVADTSGPGEPVPFLSVPGHHFRLGRGELRAYLYADSAALAHDVAGLDTVRVAPRNGSYTWSAPATLIQTGNLLAILLTANEHQIERVQLALGGGAPSRGSEPPR